jgi:ParB family transcriptional regulator, chromosome partitioning protein
MRMPWNKAKPIQLDLLSGQEDAEQEAQAVDNCTAEPACAEPNTDAVPTRTSDATGVPLMLKVEALFEDPNNPRTDFPEAELAQLADDIQQHGILQPIVVHLAGADGRHQIHFGAKRLRAALRAGLAEVPVVVRDAAADAYAQVAENQKRHGLTPHDLARFIKGQVDAGESNTTIAKRLGMNMTTVAHHLALLDLPPKLDAAMRSGQCTSPRTLHELSQLHQAQPDAVNALIDGGAEITRATVSAIRVAPAGSEPAKLLRQTALDLSRIDRSLTSLKSSKHLMTEDEIGNLKRCLADFAARWSQGV